VWFRRSFPFLEHRGPRATQFFLARLTRIPESDGRFHFFRSVTQRRMAMTNGNKPPKDTDDKKDQGKGQDPKQSGSK